MLEKVKQLMDEGVKRAEDIADHLNVSRATAYRLKKKVKDSEAA